MNTCMESALQRKTSAVRSSATKSGCKCEKCAKKKGFLQRSTVHEHTPDEVPDIVYDVLRSPGHPLDRDTRAFMEQRFDHDFSAVRIHTDSVAADSAKAIGATAFTAGNRIVFGEARYRPSTRPGVELIAHELTHVVQHGSQSSHESQSLHLGRHNDGEESEATSVSKNVVNGNEAVSIRASAAQKIRRQAVEEDNAGCGVCGEAGVTGTLLHGVVRREFAKAYNNRAYGLTTEILYTSTDDKENGKLDLLRILKDASGSWFVDIGELKPNNKDGRDDGRKDLVYYESQIRAAAKTRYKDSTLAEFESRRWSGGEVQDGYSKRIGKASKRRSAILFPTIDKNASPFGGALEVYLGRIENLAPPPGPITFVDPITGKCGFRAQEVTVVRSPVTPGLYLYSCPKPQERRSFLTRGGCCWDENGPILVSDRGVKQSRSVGDKSKDNGVQKVANLPTRPSDDRKAAFEILSFIEKNHKAALVWLAKFILTNMSVEAQVERVRVVVGFISEFVSKHREVIALIGRVSAAALLAFLVIAITPPALALAAALIGAIRIFAPASSLMLGAPTNVGPTQAVGNQT